MAKIADLVIRSVLGCGSVVSVVRYLVGQTDWRQAASEGCRGNWGTEEVRNTESWSK